MQQPTNADVTGASDTSSKETEVETTSEQESTTDHQFDTKDPYHQLREVDLDSERIGRSVIIASGPRSKINAMEEILGNVEAEDITKILTKEQMITIGFNAESAPTTPANDVHYARINESNFANTVSYMGKAIGIRPVAVNAAGKLTGDNAITKFKSRLGMGKVINLTLWHSGFSLAITPPKDSAFVNLQYNIAKQEQLLGMDTSNMVYSNYGVVINRILIDFIMQHVIGSSLTIPEGKNYLDYIKATDLDTLAIGMATCIRPGGYPYTATCRNSLEFNNSKPLCDFTATADIIPERLLWVDRSALTSEQLAHISKTSPGSHTIEDVLKYQQSLSVNAPKDISVVSSNNDTTIFTIQTPTLRKYIDNGEMWVNSIIAGANSLFEETDSPEVRNSRIDTLMLASVLNKYNSFVTKIDLDDSYVEDDSSIMGILETLSDDVHMSKDFINKVVNHIDNEFISCVAMTNFECPKCKESGREASQSNVTSGKLKEFIPINAVEHFFDQSTLKYTQIVNRQR